MTTNQSRKQSSFRRTIAGLAAAGAIAFGGLGTLSTSDAQAAGVKTQTYVVAPASVQVSTGSTTSTPPKKH